VARSVRAVVNAWAAVVPLLATHVPAGGHDAPRLDVVVSCPDEPDVVVGACLVCLPRLSRLLWPVARLYDGVLVVRRPAVAS